MFEKLKTLDDINLYNSYKNNSLLRYEAIKWIKELHNIPTTVSASQLGNRIKIEVDGIEIFDENKIENVMKIAMFDAQHVIKWIRYFFNIEDKDLNE